MKVLNLFSKRQKLVRGEVPDVYVYDEIPKTLRVQIIHILGDSIGNDVDEYSGGPCKEAYRDIHDSLCREYGFFRLNDVSSINPMAALFNFFMSCDETDKVLDIIELSFLVIDTVVRKNYRFEQYTSLSPDDAIKEVNYRFREHGVGYQYESGQIIRIDSQILHSEVIKPTLNLLSDPIYKGANTEFLRAHENYRKQKYPECLNECLKAFESTMKIICSKRDWHYNSNDSARKLIQTCFTNGLIPSFLQSEFSSLQAILESGVPTTRNKLSAHGQGIHENKVPEQFASYILNLTASNILFLIQSELKLP